MSNDISELGKKVGLAAYSTNKMVERIVRDMYIRTYKEILPNDSDSVKEHKEKINKIIKDKWQEKTGRPFDYQVFKKAMPRPIFCMGPPGQGKTASFLAAGKKFCDETGFRYIRDVTDDYVPNTDGMDFPVVVQETAGENSAITFGGVPKAVEEPVVDASGKPVMGADGKQVTRSVLKRALNYRFTIFDRTAGGLVLFDDAANASTMIQNVLLPVAQTNSFQALKLDALIGFTGNLGALDGTHTAELSAALITRVNAFYVQDNPEDYVRRGYETYNDDLGDLGFLSYLKRNPTEFAELPRTGDRSGFACSRSHTNFIEGARCAVEANGGRGRGENNSLAEISALAVSCYGPKYGGKIVAFYQTYIQGADPLARAALVDGKLDSKQIQAKYKDGTSAESMMFGYQFVTACSDYFVTEVGALMAKMKLDKNKALSDAEMNKLIGSEEFKNLSQRLGNAMLLLETQEFSFGLEHLKGKLVSYAPALATVNGNSRDVANAFGDALVINIHELPVCSKNYSELMVTIITGTNRNSSNFTASRTRAAGRTRLAD